jgi:hypothetical protein
MKETDNLTSNKSNAKRVKKSSAKKKIMIFKEIENDQKD